MNEADMIEMASRRLSAALEALEAAVEFRGEADRSGDALAAQIQAFGADRARLASELDLATARARGLEATGREVAQRISGAIDMVRSVLESDERV
jgi:CRP-like cAMP-binding protein